LDGLGGFQVLASLVQVAFDRGITVWGCFWRDCRVNPANSGMRPLQGAPSNVDRGQTEWGCMGKGHNFGSNGAAEGSICIQWERWADIQLPEFGSRCVLAM